MRFLNWRKLLEGAGFVVVSLGLIFLGLIQGFQTYSFTVDLFFIFLEIIFIEAVASSLFLTGFLVLSGLLFFWRLGFPKATERVESGKSVCCIVPTYKDSDVLENSIGSLLDSSYKDFEVLIVCEENDQEGIEKAEELSENDKVDLLINTKYPGSKAGAINFAAEETDSDIIALFDADQKISSDFLPRAVSLMRDNQVVQGRHLPRPEGFIESLAYYESLIFSYIVRQPLNFLTGFRLIGSRATVIRRSVFEQLGGYSNDTLTEDYDFAHKCYRENIDTDEMFLEPVTEEAAHSFMDWWGQRKRWMIGYFQVFWKTTRLGFKDYQGYRSVLSLVISGGSILGSILMLTLISKFVILLLIGAELIYLIPLGSVWAISLIGRLYDRKSGNLNKIGYSWILTPLIFPFFSLITIKAFFETLLHGEKDWYRVEKS